VHSVLPLKSQVTSIRKAVIATMTSRCCCDVTVAAVAAMTSAAAEYSANREWRDLQRQRESKAQASFWRQLIGNFHTDLANLPLLIVM